MVLQLEAGELSHLVAMAIFSSRYDDLCVCDSEWSPADGEGLSV